MWCATRSRDHPQMVQKCENTRIASYGAHHRAHHVSTSARAESGSDSQSHSQIYLPNSPCSSTSNGSSTKPKKTVNHVAKKTEESVLQNVMRHFLHGIVSNALMRSQCND